LIFRNANTLARFTNITLFIDREPDTAAVLDGDVCFDREGRPRFYDLMFRSGEPAFVAFDVRAFEGRYLRERPLIERKKILRRLIPRRSSFVLVADYIETRGCGFFLLACERDFEVSWRSGRPRHLDLRHLSPRGLRSRFGITARRGIGGAVPAVNRIET
jgi:bifunctional non-homologous end joining protein LigD